MLSQFISQFFSQVFGQFFEDMLEEKYPSLQDPNSPTVTVGTAPSVEKIELVRKRKTKQEEEENDDQEGKKADKQKKKPINVEKRLEECTDV